MTPPPAAIQLRNRACAAMGVRLDQLQGDSRHPHLILARRVVTVLLRDVELLSFPTIAEAIGPDTCHASAQDRYRAGKGCTLVAGWVEDIMAQSGSNGK